MAKREQRMHLKLVGQTVPAAEPTVPDNRAYAIWKMNTVRGEPGLLGRNDGQPVIERRSGKAQIISLGPLESLASHLNPREKLTVRLSMTSAKNGVLEAVATGHGKTKEQAALRRDLLNRGLDAVFKTALPHVEMAEHSDAGDTSLPHVHELAPEGTHIPLEAVGKSTSGQTSKDSKWRARGIELPATLSPADLHNLGSIIETLKCDIVIELEIEQVPLDGTRLEMIERALDAARVRRTDDAQNYYHRDERYTAAIHQLERLIVGGHALRLTTRVSAARALNDLELSLVSSAIFGTRHKPLQHNPFRELRQLYVHDHATLTLLGFTLAAVAPCQERREVSELEGLKGIPIGKSAGGHLVKMSVENPRSHTYSIGRSGAGKSTLIINMALQDAIDGKAVIVIDPHGDLCDDIYMRIPKDRMKDVLYFHCADPKAFPLVNPMERRPDADPTLETSRIVDNMKRMIRKVLYPGYDPDAFGPIYEDLIQAALYLLVEALGDDARATDVERVVVDRDWRRELMRKNGVSKETRDKWHKYERVDENWHKLENLTPYVTSKLAVFTQNQLIRPILDGRDLSSKEIASHKLDFEQALRDKKIVLINLAVTQMGEAASTLIGGLVTMKLYDAAKRQPRDAKNERPSAAVYLDEFQTYATEILADMMAETRKFGLRITLANQTLGQLRGRGRDHLHAILGNASNLVLFGVDTEDAVYLSQRFPGMLAPSELASLPNYEAVCRFQTKAKAYGPLRIRTLPAPKALRQPPERDL